MYYFRVGKTALTGLVQFFLPRENTLGKTTLGGGKSTLGEKLHSYLVYFFWPVQFFPPEKLHPRKKYTLTPGSDVLQYARKRGEVFQDYYLSATDITSQHSLTQIIKFVEDTKRLDIINSVLSLGTDEILELHGYILRVGKAAFAAIP